MFQSKGFDLGRISTQGKAVAYDWRCKICISGFSPESECRDSLVGVVGEQNPRNGVNCILVLIGLSGVDEVEG